LGVCISEQFFEQRPVVNHGFAQVFGADFAAALAKSNAVSDPIVFHDDWMVNGNIGGTLIEVRHGIAAGLHQLVDQLIGLGERSFGVVNKIRLHDPPAFREVDAGFFSERT
jgi:hypothetical protein